jgi:riboflavin kinase/FMN adenylyltransferase
VHIQLGLNGFLPKWEEAVVCIGTFDGVHLGHQKVIGQAVSLARSKNIPCILVTFDRHPAKTLRPDKCPQAISTLGQNLEVIKQCGIDITVILRFDKELAETTAQDFLDKILRQHLHVTTLVIGHDFAFGKGREGTGEWLSERIETVVVPAYELEGERVSSSGIRAALNNNDLSKARKWLGRNYALDGIVAHGEKVGRTLGFPTANLALLTDQIIPAVGIYGGIAITSYGNFRAAISVGYKPTFGEHALGIEAYLLDYPGESLYGHSLRLEFIEYIRGEVKYESVEQLTQQIQSDVLTVRNAQW